MAQQNKHTGLPTYFLPLRAGAKKKWGTKTRDFWCCYGTMVQAQTLYPELCYFLEEEKDRLVIGQYIPSEVTWGEGEKRVTVSQSVDMKSYNAQAFFDEKDESQMSRWLLKFTVKANRHFTLSLRVPQWVKSAPEVTINGQKPESVEITEGYLNLERDWAEDAIQPRYEHTYDVFPWQQSTYQTVGQAQNEKLVPLYDVTDESYTVYHTIS